MEVKTDINNSNCCYCSKTQSKIWVLCQYTIIKAEKTK